MSLETGSAGRILQFRKTVKQRTLRKCTDTAAHGLNPRQAAQRPHLASRIYLFRRSVLVDLLSDPSAIDFRHRSFWPSSGTTPSPISSTDTGRRNSRCLYKANIDLQFRAALRLPICLTRCTRTAAFCRHLGLSGTSGIRDCGRFTAAGSEHHVRCRNPQCHRRRRRARSRSSWEPIITRMTRIGPQLSRWASPTSASERDHRSKAIIDKNAHRQNVPFSRNRPAEHDGNGYYIGDGIVIMPSTAYCRMMLLSEEKFARQTSAGMDRRLPLRRSVSWQVRRSTFPSASPGPALIAVEAADHLVIVRP
jgi:hypothetical protein